MTLRFGYITNGLAEHRLSDALQLLADHGYSGVGLTLGHHHLDPFAPDLRTRLLELRRLLDRLELAVVIETGARFLLDPRHKHEPSLISEGRERRLDLLVRSVEIAAELGAEAVSFFSGVVPESLPVEEAWRRLTTGCEELLEAAALRGVTLGFEPEPGMLIDRLEGYERLAGHLGNPVSFGIGSASCAEDGSGGFAFGVSIGSTTANAASANGSRLVSTSCGLWSDMITSSKPLASASTSATRSASARSGGVTLKKVR